ncbi:hypothetical protein DEU56DRAFT_908421 [Suillus clintonianus]|uniref:uncharacterized protein n=1 Tax=Suillus clintonianus TaxID=1904413 RepID=UPI001B8794C1|nr:uncharacterized protein DEU56DRAFT_908421 [Suillus clintonianus]KAG2150781.1 hypothetical protein DEU56DRAFT_908421 [Suillus clintonianus]
MAKHHLRSNSTNTSIPKPISSASTICPSVHTNTLQAPIVHGAGPITTVMSTPTSKITAITLSHTDLEKIELLDRGQNNWGTWSAKIHNYLLLKHGGGYLLGVIPHPNDILDPAGASTWDLNNLCIVTALSTRSCTEDQDFLLPFTEVHAAWLSLKPHHEQVGPIAQILLIQQALSPTPSSLAHPLLPMVPSIFVPTSNWNNSSSTMTKGRGPVTSPCWLQTKGSNLTAATPHAQIVANLPTPAAAPLAAGGTMEEKKDKIIVRRRAARAGGGGGTTGSAKPPGPTTSCPTKGASTGKPGGLHYNTNGRAYLLDAETHEAIFVASTPGNTTPTQEFAGLAHDTLSSAFIEDLPDDAFDTLFAAIDLQASVDWHTHSQSVDFAGITYKAPNQCARTPIDPSVVPFFLDTC